MKKVTTISLILLNACGGATPHGEETPNPSVTPKALVSPKPSIEVDPKKDPMARRIEVCDRTLRDASYSVEVDHVTVGVTPKGVCRVWWLHFEPGYHRIALFNLDDQQKHIPIGRAIIQLESGPNRPISFTGLYEPDSISAWFITTKRQKVWVTTQSELGVYFMFEVSEEKGDL